MSVSPEIAAKQAAYAARPFAAYVNSSHFSGCFRFATAGEAIDYLLSSFKRAKAEISAPDRSAKWGNSWLGWDARRSYLEINGEKIPAMYVLMHDSLSSSAQH